MNRRLPHWCSRLTWIGLLAASLFGCAPQAAAPPPIDPAAAGIQLGLLVVDDPHMAAAIQSLSAEWKARTGAAVSVEQLSTADLLAASELKAGLDAVIFPSCQLGPLVERKWIAPLRTEYATDRELAWSDTFELLQVAETRWGQIPYAIPFGSPVLTCYYRADLLERFHRRPPRTWQEYHELATFFQKEENRPESPPGDGAWSGTIEPLAAPWAGRVLLARAAAYAKHRDHFSTLFKIDTMEPLIAGPAFVWALEELAADARLTPTDARTLDPPSARRRFLAGHSALALSWPTQVGANKNGADKNDDDAQAIKVGFVELPGSEEVYNVGVGAWEKRLAEESVHIPTLGLAGRLGAVLTQSGQPEKASQLLAWLSGLEWGTKISSASDATTLYRHSQIRAPQAWLAPGTDAEAAKQYATSVKDALSRQAYLFALGIPGQESYLAALDAAVEHVLGGQQSPAEALAEAAETWRKITAERGLDNQRRAYRKRLGLESE